MPMKMQSAMEYLTTYGWAILVIALVVGVLYSLGVFNSIVQSPKLQPGGCFVDRPNGPGTNQFMSLEGTCTDELPEYVMVFYGSNSFVDISNYGVIDSASSLTVSAWVETSSSSSSQMIFSSDSGSSNGIELYVSASGNAVALDDAGSVTGSGTINNGKWYDVAAAYGPNSISVYVDGSLVGNVAESEGPAQAFLDNQIGASCTGAYGTSCSNYFHGEISNVQLYNTTLPSSTELLLYQEGLGGVPNDFLNLVGWWMLNGNGDDYSGDSFNGNSIGVSYTGEWTSTYTAP